MSFDCLKQVADVGNPILAKESAARRYVLIGQSSRLHGWVTREEDHRHSGVLTDDQVAQGDTTGSVAEHDVHQNDIGIELVQGLPRRSSRSGLTHVKAVGAQNLVKQCRRQVIILHYQ